MNKKNQIVSITKILIISSIAKILSLVSKIIMTRELGLYSMSIFSLTNPLLLLLLTLSSLSLQNSISAIIAKDYSSRKKVLFNALKLTLALSTILMFVLLLSGEFISYRLIKNPLTLKSIYACLLVIPLTSISSIIKGYFLGIGEIKLITFSQIFEESGRFLLIAVVIFFLPTLNDQDRASLAVYSLAIGELFQIFYMVFYYKNYSLKKLKEFIFSFKQDKHNYKDILNISLPMTCSRLVGSLTYFIEPILFTSILLNQLKIEEITISYGLLTQYALPILLMPSFISVTISNLIISNLGKLIGNNKFLEARKYIRFILLLSFIIGLIISIFFTLFSNQITSLIYNNTYGSEIIKKYSILFSLFYIESPLITCLSILNLSKKALISTVISSIIRILLILLLVKFYQIDGLCLAIIISFYFNVIINLFFLMKFFISKNKRSIIHHQ